MTSNSQNEFIEVTAEEKQLFPENFGEKFKASKNSIFNIPRFLESSPDDERIKCEQNVIKCLEKYPLAKIMLNALSKAGCNVNLRRHFSCELCSDKVTGGYDARKNKIIVCYNHNKSEKNMTTTISHELLHMWDNCVSEFDPKNLEHIACTEIRAASLFHCGMLSSLVDSSVLIFEVYKGFRTCVRRKAINTLVHSGRVDEEKATKIVDKVFDRCYNDTEPVGRRFLHTIKDQERCYRERHIYGYD